MAKVTGVGSSATSGAIRLATSIALQSFVDEKMRERMRLGEARQGGFDEENSDEDYRLVA